MECWSAEQALYTQIGFLALPDCVKSLNRSFSMNEEARARILFLIGSEWSRLS
jgi:hypothetical protein